MLIILFSSPLTTPVTGIELNIQAFATAICGNDILSSCLYVSGIAITFAGIYAHLVLLFVAGVLLLFKYIYTEVVEALPINGAIRLTRRWSSAQEYLDKHFRAMIEGTFIIFIHKPSQLHHYLDYVNKNETGKNIILVHCLCKCEPIQERTKEFDEFGGVRIIGG